MCFALTEHDSALTLWPSVELDVLFTISGVFAGRSGRITGRTSGTSSQVWVLHPAGQLEIILLHLLLKMSV